MGATKGWLKGNKGEGRRVRVAAQTSRRRRRKAIHQNRVASSELTVTTKIKHHEKGRKEIDLPTFFLVCLGLIGCWEIDFLRKFSFFYFFDQFVILVFCFSTRRTGTGGISKMAAALGSSNAAQFTDTHLRLSLDMLRNVRPGQSLCVNIPHVPGSDVVVVVQSQNIARYLGTFGAQPSGAQPLFVEIPLVHGDLVVLTGSNPPREVTNPSERMAILRQSLRRAEENRRRRRNSRQAHESNESGESSESSSNNHHHRRHPPPSSPSPSSSSDPSSDPSLSSDPSYPRPPPSMQSPIPAAAVSASAPDPASSHNFNSGGIARLRMPTVNVHTNPIHFGGHIEPTPPLQPSSFSAPNNQSTNASNRAAAPSAAHPFSPSPSISLTVNGQTHVVGATPSPLPPLTAQPRLPPYPAPGPDHEDLICSICYEFMHQPSRTRCECVFCNKCIKNWLMKNGPRDSASCPRCRCVCVKFNAAAFIFLYFTLFCYFVIVCACLLRRAHAFVHNINNII